MKVNQRRRCSREKAGRSRVRRRPKKSILLDAFAQPDLDTWNRHGDALQAAADRVYFDHERQRAAQYETLCKSLHANDAIAIDVAVRCIDRRLLSDGPFSAGSGVTSGESNQL
jgi:hypothetical protein